MQKGNAGAILRPKTATDDRFILALADRVFGRYSTDPVFSTAAMLNGPAASAIVAEHDGARAGFVIVSVLRWPRPFGPLQRPTLAHVDAIAVRPEAQGLGIGRLLLEAAEETARSEDALSLTLLTAETNVRARELFTSAGFQPVVRLPNSYRGGQRGISMMKLLG
jgi:ribosomal protein S18 acetylase RimI-like enzyme